MRTNDQVPVEDLCKDIRGKLYGDKGYLGQKLFNTLWDNGITACYQHSIKYEEQAHSITRIAKVFSKIEDHKRSEYKRGPEYQGLLGFITDIKPNKIFNIIS